MPTRQPKYTHTNPKNNDKNKTRQKDPFVSRETPMDPTGHAVCPFGRSSPPLHRSATLRSNETLTNNVDFQNTVDRNGFHLRVRVLPT